MTDRELLEAAAKAMGIEHPGGEHCAFGPALWDCNKLTWWRPLTDDGDALRLAVKMNLIGKHSFEDALREENDACEGDYYAATRRSIVRAAAAIGGAK